jgi:tRNA-splicing ligase RtcB
MMIENHHNFAWKEQLADGTEVMVHRKGATPAGEGVWVLSPEHEHARLCGAW